MHPFRYYNVLIFRTITSGPSICDPSPPPHKKIWNLSEMNGSHNYVTYTTYLRSPRTNILKPCRSLSPTLKNIIFFSQFDECTIMTFGERKGPNVVIYTFSVQYICNVNKSAWVFYIYFIPVAIHVSVVSVGYSQLIFSRNWQLRKFEGRSLQVCCVLVEVSFMHFLSDGCNNTNNNCVLLAHVLFVSCLLVKSGGCVLCQISVICW